MQWTHDQQRAIDLRDTDILVTAAAGSGKTAVLVERILSLLKEGRDISRMLIVTFTRAAASSMRDKLSRRLYEIAAEDESLLPQAERVESAAICTIDSFCAEFLRTHFAAAGVDPSFRIVEENERDRLLDKAVRQALSEAYQDPSPAFQRLSRWRDPDAIIQDATQIITFRDAQPDGDAWNMSPPLSDDLRQLELAAQDCLTEAAHSAAYVLTQCAGPAEGYLSTIQADRADLEHLASLAGDLLRHAVDGYSFARMPSLRGGASKSPEAEEVKAARDAYKDQFKKAKGYLTYDPAQSDADHAENQLQLSALLSIVRRAESLLRDYLDEDNALGFPDMAHRTLRALDDPDIARAARDAYRDAVFVDEYQDVSALQDALIQRLATPGSLFMVGDVKQSIYRFRLAEPRLFMQRYRRFGDHDGGERVALSANFRSHSPILDYTNLVFRRAMNRPRSEIVYDEEAELKVGPAENQGGDPVEVYLLSGAAEEEDDGEGESIPSLDTVEREARVAAWRIQSLMAENPALHYRDFAILSRANSVFPDLSEFLALRGIPTESSTASSFYDTMEIRVALALLRLTENRLRDPDWIAALRSPACALTLDELAQIRLSAPNADFSRAVLSRMEAGDDLARRLQAFAALLDQWRSLSGTLTVQQLIYTVLRQSGLLAQAAALPGGTGRVNRLTALCDEAASYDALRHTGLSGFLSNLEEAQRQESQKMRTAPESSDAVHLMSIHASKGLEYPVVIGVGLGKKLSGKKDGELLLHAKLGVGAYCVDPDLGAKRDTVERRAVYSALSDEDLEEELRLLYVLITRARDRAILIGSVKDLEKAMADYRAHAHYCPRPKSLLDCLVPPLLASSPDYARLIVDPVIPASQAPSAASEGPSSGPGDLSFRQAYLWKYPHEDAALSPLKMTVSALKREMTGPASMPDLQERPAFMTQSAPTGAEMGTATHQLLRSLRLDDLRGLSPADLRSHIRAQMEENLRACRMALPADPELAARFLESPLGRRLLASPTVRREWAFNLVTTPRQVGHSDSDEPMLMQGAIDLCFMENDAWILVDYKTDWDDSVLIQRYAPQLRLYARALFEITKKPVREIWICALRKGRQLLLP